ncbi:MAG TPA: zinc-binding dehydrogenase [Solimonas sp.]|nr:zinc-binding dehydrogenase [Solimonas sp.]
MKSVICQNAELRVVDRPALKPGKGQVLLQVLRCGICGSDLHMRQHCDHMSDLVGRLGYPHIGRSSDEVVFGHEFCGEILDYGPRNLRKLPTGTRVCAVPMLRVGKEIDLVGLTPRAPGAYAEQVLVQASLMMPVPNGLDADHAAMTEPMAVALHAVRRSQIRKGEVAIVIGCGPVGLGVICMLKASGVKTIVASDFSAGRRELALRCGADVVIDPKQGSPFDNWKEYGFLGTAPMAFELVVGTREKLGLLPVPWWRAWRLAEALGAMPKRPVIFECVGVPGVLQKILEGAPMLSRVVVVGVCMQADTIEPALAINKEIELRFVLGYTPLEYRDALHMIAEGEVACGHMLTGTVGLEGVSAAFDALRDPERHAKILIDPQRRGDAVG